jgi:hypothetical protein
MSTPIENAARNILATMRRTYGSAPTRVQVQARDFRALDLAAYERVTQELAGAGYLPLLDYAITEINASPTSLIAPTFIRTFATRDGATVANYYQRRPRWGRLARTLWRGVMNGRLVDAPRMALGAAATRHCLDFACEFADGHWVFTSNAEGAEMVGTPPQMDRKFLPYGAGTAQVLAEHQARQAAAIALHGAPLPVRSSADLHAMLGRESAAKNAHRAAIGWVTHGELVKMSGGNRELADQVYAEVRTQLREGG